MTDLIKNNSELSKKIEKMKSDICQKNVPALLISEEIHKNKKRRAEDSEDTTNSETIDNIIDNRKRIESPVSILKTKKSERIHIQSDIINKAPAQVNFTPCTIKSTTNEKTHEAPTNSELPINYKS
jgi:hypothetical protein